MTEIALWFTGRPSVWISSFLLALLFGLGFLEIRQTRKPEKGAQHDQDLARKPQSLVGQRHPTEDEHRSAQQAYWNRQIESQNRPDWVGWVTLAFSGVAAIGVILSFQQTRRQADIARDSYVATTRAWFDVDVDLSEISLKWRDGVGASLRVKVEGTNNGNSPAIEASVSSRLAADEEILGASSKEIVKDSCTTWTPVNGGDLVFMKEPIETFRPTFVQWYKMQPFFNIMTDDNSAISQAKSSMFVQLYFIACVIYKITGDDEWHHTARIFRVFRLDELEPVRGSYQLKVGEDLEGDRLTLVREDIGAYAN